MAEDAGSFDLALSTLQLAIDCLTLFSSSQDAQGAEDWTATDVTERLVVRLIFSVVAGPIIPYVCYPVAFVSFRAVYTDGMPVVTSSLLVLCNAVVNADASGRRLIWW